MMLQVLCSRIVQLIPEARPSPQLTAPLFLSHTKIVLRADQESV